MVIQKRILSKIETYLKTKYNLDPLRGDMRLSYVLYYGYQQELLDVPQLRQLIYDTHNLFKDLVYATKETFERAVYRALAKAFPEEVARGDKTRLRQYLRLLEEIKDYV